MIKKIIISLTIIIAYSLLGFTDLQAQSEKKELGIEDLKLWRSHSVNLSDNGEWYTVLYRLNEKVDAKQDSAKAEYASQIAKKFFDAKNQTDVLYICNAKNGIKYEIKNGKRPIFSASSDWIAYQIKDDSKEEKKDKKGKEDLPIIELKHLATGFTVKYKSKASFSFAELASSVLADTN